MKKILIVLFSLVLTVLTTSCDFKYPKSEFDAMEQEAGDLTARNMDLRAQIRELNKQIETLQSGAGAQTAARSDSDPFDEKVLADLLTRADLVPAGDSGEALAFVPELCRVLGETYVYAYAQTEKSAADMIFAYTKKSDETFDWTLELCNKGSGWLPMNEKQAAVQGIGALEPKDEAISKASSAGDSSGASSASSSVGLSGASSASSSGGASSASSSRGSSGTSSTLSSGAAPGASSSKGDAGALWTGKGPIPTELEQETFKNIADRVA